jgi:hypothetical protein
MKRGKKTRQLPSRGGLNDLDKSKRTVADYSKASPITPSEPTPNIVQNLRKKKAG